MRSLRRHALLSIVVVAASVPVFGGAPPSAPVTITYSPLPAAKQNEEATTTVAVRADADLQRLEIAVRAGDGVAIASPPGDVSVDGVKSGDTRRIPVTVRLTDAHAGTIVVFVKATLDSAETTVKNTALLIGTPVPPTRSVVDAQEDVSQLTLVNSGGGNAAIRFGRKPLRVVTVGDRVGKTTAEVKSIAEDRLVLEETVVAPDGSVARFEIVVRKGETGGTRTPVQRD